jgi:hypothetical protein
LAPQNKTLAAQFRKSFFHRSDGNVVCCRQLVFGRNHLVGFPYAGSDGGFEDFLELMVKRDERTGIQPGGAG